MRIPAAALAAGVVAIFVALAASAMLRNSTTFDEIVFPAAGARALKTGDFGMVIDHPRLPQYVYGFPLYASGVNYPPEKGMLDWKWFTRYQYGEAMYWASGNDGEHVAALSRSVAIAFGSLTVLATFLFARRHMPAYAAVFAAALLAFVPDVLAHSGVAYNDMPVALAILVGTYALDALVRRPTPRNAALAGLAVAFAACMKYSGLVLLPVGAILLAIEAASGRRHDAAWRGALLRAAAVFAAAAYAAMVIVYPGDWLLGEYTTGLAELPRSTLSGNRPGFLLGERRVGGWWYFFPVAFALKTPLGLHLLALAAAAAGVLAARGGAWRAWASHGARASAVAAALILAIAMASRTNLGMRHVLPLLPFVCILIAQGVAWLYARHGRKAAVFAAACFVAMAGSTLRYYPYFLSYLSEYAQGRPVYETLIDSNTDWGQGLIGLREWMRARGVDRVALGYFGSALPGGYGVRYVAMPGYYQAGDDLPPRPEPRYLVVSATLLAGSYLAEDVYAGLRKEKPVDLIAGSLYVFDLQALQAR